MYDSIYIYYTIYYNICNLIKGISFFLIIQIKFHILSNITKILIILNFINWININYLIIHYDY